MPKFNGLAFISVFFVTLLHCFQDVAGEDTILLARDSSKGERTIEDGNDYEFLTAGGSVILQQKKNGKLKIRLGTIDNPGSVIWETEPEGDYDSGDRFTRLWSNGDLVTKLGTPANKGATVWRSGIDSENGDYVFALTADMMHVFVSEDKIENALWYEATSLATSPPAEPPTDSPVDIEEPTGSPVDIPITDDTILLARDSSKGERNIEAGIKYEFATTGGGITLEQKKNGKLKVRLGTIDNPGNVIWETEPDQDNVFGGGYTRLQGNGDLVTKLGTPDNKGPTVWRSGSDSENGNYIFALSADMMYVFISEDTIENALWYEATSFMPTICESDIKICDDERTFVSRNPLENCDFEECPPIGAADLPVPRCLPPGWENLTSSECLAINTTITDIPCWHSDNCTETGLSECGYCLPPTCTTQGSNPNCPGACVSPYCCATDVNNQAGSTWCY